MYIAEHAARHPDKPAIIMAESGESRSFGELEANSNRAARLFRACGLHFRDHMAFLLENSLVFYDVCFGADRAGLYYTAIPTKLTAPEIAYIVNDCGARLLVIGAAFAHMKVARRWSISSSPAQPPKAGATGRKRLQASRQRRSPTKCRAATCCIPRAPPASRKA